eukprot:5499655-Amphidinium_carterae.1
MSRVHKQSFEHHQISRKSNAVIIVGTLKPEKHRPSSVLDWPQSSTDQAHEVAVDLVEEEEQEVRAKPDPRHVEIVLKSFGRSEKT